MSTRRLKPSRIGYTNEQVPWHYGWNPGGYGCSNNCPRCWARRQGRRMKGRCDDCAEFRVHSHPERLCEPANTKKPGVVLCNFTCDTFDRQRPDEQIGAVLGAADCAPQHTYVWLTQQAGRVAAFLAGRLLVREYPQNWYLGLTLRTQAEADEKWPVFSQIPGNLWISYEPAWSGIELRKWVGGPGNDGLSDDPQGHCWRCGCEWGDDDHECPEGFQNGLCGVICGHDNRKGAPGTDTLDHIRSVVRQCEAAGVNVFVKQIWILKCRRCGTIHDERQSFPSDKGWPAEHRENDGCHACMGAPLRWKLLRASHPDEYALYPADLRRRELPWRMPEDSTRSNPDV